MLGILSIHGATHGAVPGPPDRARETKRTREPTPAPCLGKEADTHRRDKTNCPSAPKGARTCHGAPPGGQGSTQRRAAGRGGAPWHLTAGRCRAYNAIHMPKPLPVYALV